jgi:fumarylpyruvate hydrolase
VLRLSVNGAVRQQATLAEMIHDVPAIIVALSTLFELHAGDLVFTGTPSGVAALQRGDQLHAELVDVAELHTRII